ncbi:MAG: IS91 family transposase [Candidatus Thiodiazotropha sp. (ex. Lucinisca nassula)]|nr:IS91 family transposase [Candidatus Thiodiazotropha sp. (ex. Lucinisca nassula)]
MSQVAITDRSPQSPPYKRHRPEQTLLYQIIERHYPEFRDVMATQGKPLPLHVQQEFADYLKCGRLEHGFLRVQCSECHHEHLVAFSCKRRGFCPSCGARRMAESAALLVDEVIPEQPIRQWVLSFPFQLRFLFASRPQLMGRVLGIVYRAISSHLIQKAGFTRKTAQTGAVTLIQRFGSALNLNVHFHMLFLDGVYTETKHGRTRFQRTNGPEQQELIELVHTISYRVAGFLEREGILERDVENSYLNLEDQDEDPMQQVLGCSVSYRIAVGPQQGRKVFTLQTISSWEDDDRFAQVAKVSGFSLHAGVAAQAWERQKLERLCRYISRPAVSEKRLSLTPSGNIRYQLKTPYSDGTTHVIFEPLDFIAKLAALVPKPRVNLTRFHGVFAPNSKYRVDVTPAKRGKGNPTQSRDDKTPEQRRQAMTWAQRLKRAFNIDVSICPQCGGEAKVIACIEEQAVIDTILAHLMKKGALPPPPELLPATRASPDTGWFT